jgi:hypothetical protein
VVIIIHSLFKATGGPGWTYEIISRGSKVGLWLPSLTLNHLQFAECDHKSFSQDIKNMG